MRPAPKSNPVKKNSPKATLLGEIHENAIHVVVYERVLEDILDYSEQDLSRELGGFLIGNYQLDGQPRVEVRHFLEAVDVRSHAASLTFTHETWANVNREVAERFPQESIVGWHHTHPKLRVFLSGYDMFIHRHFFKEPWQIAMVVDPVHQEFGFFQWRGTDIVDCGFICVADRRRPKA